MVNKKTIMIDMDDVIVDCGFLYLVNEFLGTNYKDGDITTYYIQDIIPKQKFEDFKKFFKTKNMYEYVKFLPNALETIKKLSEVYDVYIVTSHLIAFYPEMIGDYLKYKFNFLHKKLSFMKPQNFVFLCNKELFKADVKIDDRLSNLKGDSKVKFLMNAYHNKNITDMELKKENVKRVNNWKEIEKLLLN